LIFVSVGTLNKPFNRLLEGIDLIANKIGDEIIAQIGYSTYIPKRYRFFRFCEHDEMLSHIQSARFVICQAGFGIIGNCIRLKKPMILVPREIRYGEAIDKQYELAEYLASKHRAILCIRDISKLADAIERIEGVQVDYDYKTDIPAIIKNFISQTFFKEK